MLPNIKEKYTEKSITDPMSYIEKYKEGIAFNGDVALIIYPYAASIFLNSARQNNLKIKKDKKYIIVEDKILCCISQISSPNVTISIEEMRIFNIRKLINIGIAGSINRDLNIGDIVLCEKAIRDEGSSYHYLKPSKYAYSSKKLLNYIEKKFTEFNIDFKKGGSWTIDAPYRETLKEVIKYSKSGILTVEMESSAVFAVTEYYKIQSGSIFVISDKIGEYGWEHKFNSKKINSSLTKIFNFIFDVFL
ncbi:MAG: nucleoside phosphorylase [Elusimicrobiota bacterium]